MRHVAKAVLDAGYVQASDREDTGKASGTRDSQQVQEPRTNVRRRGRSDEFRGRSDEFR